MASKFGRFFRKNLTIRKVLSENGSPNKWFRCCMSAAAESCLECRRDNHLTSRCGREFTYSPGVRTPTDSSALFTFFPTTSQRRRSQLGGRGLSSHTCVHEIERFNCQSQVSIGLPATYIELVTGRISPEIELY